MMDFTKYKSTVPYNNKEEYYKDYSRIYDLFRKDLFNELGITDNLKRDLLFSKAWELGHSAGYAEVFSYARDLVDLIK